MASLCLRPTLNRIDHSIDMLVWHVWTDRQAHRFRGEAFCDRVAAVAQTQIGIGLLAVRRDRIMDLRRDALCSERVTQSVAVRGVDDEQMPDWCRPIGNVGQNKAAVLQAIQITRSDARTAIVSGIEVRQLNGHDRRMQRIKS